MKNLILFFLLLITLCVKSSAAVDKEWVTIDGSVHFLSSGQGVGYSLPDKPRKVYEIKVFYSHREAGAVMEITSDGGIYSRIENLAVGGGTYVESAYSSSGSLSNSIDIKNVGFQGLIEIQVIEVLLQK